ncbi:hypothetical protein [Micromonospora endolithica]|uniref:GTPase n=1 Tax=Micromonospora endolithica TaxID=230091 RepID=A0A3A9ZLQ5_9ACTN|nr:hypothetical protein [Micromonospora endolithica]RKN49115.1 hypothetical protein D7223_06245 [Micromonospora endolithica]TWJ23270.1 hypothetical protein JD76_03405 [Micromonospora endolithica]
MTSQSGVIRRLVGVYHADGGLRGELAYVVGKVRGTAECALCDITHGALGRKREWRHLVPELGVPVDLVHLNERSPEIRAASEGRTPCVLAVTDDGPVSLLGPADLAALDGSVDRFAERLAAAVEATGLHWERPPTPTPRRS